MPNSPPIPGRVQSRARTRLGLSLHSNRMSFTTSLFRIVFDHFKMSAMTSAGIHIYTRHLKRPSLRPKSALTNDSPSFPRSIHNASLSPAPCISSPLVQTSCVSTRRTIEMFQARVRVLVKTQQTKLHTYFSQGRTSSDFHSPGDTCERSPLNSIPRYRRHSTHAFLTILIRQAIKLALCPSGNPTHFTCVRLYSRATRSARCSAVLCSVLAVRCSSLARCSSLVRKLRCQGARVLDLRGLLGCSVCSLCSLCFICSMC